MSDERRRDLFSFHRPDYALGTDSVVLRENAVADALQVDENDRDPGDIAAGIRNGIIVSLPFWLILCVAGRLFL